MQKTKKLLLAVLSILTAGFCTLGVAGCTDDSVSGTNGNGELTVWTMESVYAKAQELGYTGSLEEFIESISGIDGKDGVNGVGIEEIYINAEGHLLVKLTGQATHTDLGKVVGEDGDLKIENEQGLAFYLKDDGTYGVKAGTASYLTEITIPSTYKGRAVTEILEFFFGTEEENERALTQKIVIPDSVMSVGDSAFYSCYNLTSIIIPESVTNIGEYAFLDCGNLTSITIPDSVTSIGDGAFKHCISLTSITIGDSVTSIGSGAFSSCYNLTSITVSKNNANYKTVDGDLYSKDGTTLIQYAIGKTATSFVIPDSVTSIGDLAFYNCSSLTSITIPDSVTSIGEWAFYNCRSLTSITISNSITSIGELAFRDCISLTSVTMPAYAIPFIPKSNLQTVVITSGESIEEYAFYNCSSLTSITIPDSVTSIGRYAFYDCDSLTSITIPDSVTSIGNAVFSGCGNLTSITIPDSVTSIGGSAFSYCSSLTSITIPDSVTSIGDLAFYNCSSLTSITIGDSVTSIGDKAFVNCYNLTSVVFKDTSTWYCTDDYDDWINKTGEQVDVSDAAGLAVALKNISYYHNLYFYKL